MSPDTSVGGGSGDGGRTGTGLETVIGLEIHVQLKTATKMFCGDAAAYGAPPNTHVCPVCLGLPGALPVANAHAVDLGVRAALGIGCDVHLRSVFDRKNYFYPDLPKGYQITQHERPLATGGHLDLPDEEGVGEPRRVRLRRVHLEEDTGKSLHDRVPGASALDLNRAGVPLIEIVTEPEIRSPSEARRFLVRLKQALEYLEVSDCNMEEGSLRVDANLSLRAPGEAGGARTELKNLNSFANVERALRFEAARQRRLLEAGQPVEHQTLLWDAARSEARPLRSKEELHDYRYFPEPDLPPLVLDAARVEEARARLPEMPWNRARRLRREHGLPRGHAEQLTATRALADYFEAVVGAGADAREAAHWVMGEVLAAANARGCEPAALGVAPERLAALLAMLGAGRVSRPAARQVFTRMLDDGRTAEAIVADEGLAQVDDAGAIEAWVEEALRAHPAEVKRFRAGEAKLLAFFVGQVMRSAGGRADPQRVAAALEARLGSGPPHPESD